jgi:hypothetical protein
MSKQITSKRILIDPITHRVVIHGRVAIGFQLADQQQWAILPQTIPAQVKIIAAPPSFQRLLHLKSLSYGQNWDTLRPDRTRTDNNGFFYFIDLPPGDYKLRATELAKTPRFPGIEQVITIVAGKNLKQGMEFILPTTGIIGQVIAHAQVQVQGSDEKTRCDSEGNFQLLNLEAPERAPPRPVQLQISAPGYETVITAPMNLTQGIVQRLPVIQLTPKSSAKANGA